jgi:thiol:disulfide interchange protein
MKLIFPLIFGLLTTSVQAQELHSKANLVQNHDTFISGMNVGVQLDIEPGWHAYWENPGDVGAPPQMQITSSIPIQNSNLIFPIPQRIESNPYDSYGYENETLFYKNIQLEKNTNEKSIQLKIQFDWLVCKEICVPCTKSFVLDLPIRDSKQDNSHFNAFSFPGQVQAKTSLDYKSGETILTIQADVLKNKKEVDFFPVAPMKEIFNKPTSKEIKNDLVTFHYPVTKSKETIVVGLLKMDSKTAYWIGTNDAPALIVATTSPPSPKLLYVFLLAFLGGILLNLMPCVLPVVSLKVLSLLKTSHFEAKMIRKYNLWFSAGICVSLFLFSLVFIAVQRAGHQLGLGFQLQSPPFIIFLILLFFLIGLNLIGFFEIQSIPLPGIGKFLHKESPASNFFAGFFTTIVATPCTAPFMAAAVGYALSQNDWILVATFISLGLGLSFPYLLLAAVPKLGQIFPKPGAWMITLKEFLSFPMFLTVIWLVWLLAQLTDNQSILFILTALSLVVFFFWAGKKLFKKNQMTNKILRLLIGGLIFVIALSITNYKPTDVISWEPFDQEKIENYAKDSIVFVDFTADWCLTCKTNERLTFSNADVISLIQQQKIKMIKADWTRQNPEITKVLRRYERAGVPFYLLYKPSLTTPVVLPTLLTPDIFIGQIIGKGDHHEL